jgi:hypothetical protein
LQRYNESSVVLLGVYLGFTKGARRQRSLRAVKKGKLKGTNKVKEQERKSGTNEHTKRERKGRNNEVCE